MTETLDAIEGFVNQGGYHQIATANVDFLVHALHNREYRENLCRCDLVVADGMPLVMASKILGTPLKERVAGSDMVPMLAARGYRIFLLGASPEVSATAAHRLEELGAHIVGRYSGPPIPLENFDNDRILAEIEEANPEILMVALGSPKQEIWLERNRHRLKVPVCIGVGGSLDFLAGTVNRAPVWMRESGLEWVHRIWTEPKRLAGRYLKGAVVMARYLTVQLSVHIATPKSDDGLAVETRSLGSVGILSASGSLSGARLAQVADAAASLDGAVVVDLSRVTYLGADGLHLLTTLFRETARKGNPLWLASAPRWALRALRSSRCDGLFRLVPSVYDAVREASRGRLQMSIELGDGWAACRIGGEMPEGARSTIERICLQVLENNEFFDFQNDGVLEFDADRMFEARKSRPHLVAGGNKAKAMGAGAGAGV